MSIDETIKQTYHALKELEVVEEVPKNTIGNHIPFIGMKHTFGEPAKKIYRGLGITCYTIPLPNQYERITGVYK